MTAVRSANPGELAEFPTAEAGEARFLVEENGQLAGYVAVSRIDSPTGEQCWLHDAAHWGEDPAGFLLLASSVRRQVREWGYSRVMTNVLADSPMLQFWLRHGFKISQFVLEGEL